MKRIFFIFGALALFAMVPVVSAATLTVDIATDDYDVIADADCSLREAITAANSDADFGGCVGAGGYGDDSIVFDAGTNVGAAGPIQLAIAGTGEDVNTTGDLDITSNIAFVGNGNTLTVIDGGDIDRVFHNLTGTTVSFRTLQIVDGDAGATDGAGLHTASGTVLFTGVIVTSNVTTGNGGGIYANNSTVNLTSSTVSANQAADGAGIYNNGVAPVTIDGSTIQLNVASDDGGGIFANDNVDVENSSLIDQNDADQGGGIFIQGANEVLTVDDSTISANDAVGSTGGGIHIVSSTANILNDAAVSSNTAVTLGAGIYNTNGTLNITNATVNSNVATLNGGGIMNISASAVATITTSTINGNTANGGIGGGIRNQNDAGMFLYNSTVSGNTAATSGGNISNGALSPTITIDSSTIANSGGGEGLEVGSGTVTIRNSILDNTVDCSVAGTLTSNGYNLESGVTCGFTGTGDIQNGTANLAALADNGGLTQTHALLTGSDAIDAGNTTLTVDQRGLDRNEGLADDIGSFELSILPVLAEVTPVPTPTANNTPSYTFSSTDSGTITYGGDCSSSTTNAVGGNNTVTFNLLTNGTYSNCTITVTDVDANVSAALAVSAFEISSSASTGSGGSGSGGSGIPGTCVHISCLIGGGSTNPPTTESPVEEEDQCSGYDDVWVSDPDCPAIEYVQSIGAMTGHDDGHFGPEEFVQRDQMAKISLEAFGLFDESADYCGGVNPFPDVISSMWSYQYICRGKQIGMITGYQSGPNIGMYMPGEYFNLVEFWALVLRNVDEEMPAGESFDGFEADAWYSGYAKFVADHGLYDGTSPSPTDFVSRRDVADFLYDIHAKGLL